MFIYQFLFFLFSICFFTCFIFINMACHRHASLQSILNFVLYGFGKSTLDSNLYYTYSNNTLLVPGTTTSHSGNLLLSPSHRGISYPPPSPTRVPLRRGMAFSTSTKNPPLVKTRNITSQNSINWSQLQSTSPSLQQRHKVASNASNSVLSLPLSGAQLTQNKSHGISESTTIAGPETKTIQLSNENLIDGTCQQQQHPQQMPTCNETDV
uniref:Leishmanolysin n=1 Tax=Zeugodacus cucurbitae TaxID=28588 RepID=A0A0A1XEK5_ZEUCU